jgi:hypothetical protein
MTRGPTPEQVATQAALILRQRPEARVIGITIPGAWLGGTTLQVNGTQCPVAFCTSVLQICEVLTSYAETSPPLVIVTPLDDGQLGLNLLVRFAGRRLYRLDRWHLVCDLFRARYLDPRLASQGWVADALLQRVPEEGYPPVASGLLDVDTVWTHLCRQYLGLDSGRPDAVTLIEWSLSSDNLRRYEVLTTEFRAGLRQRVVDTTGSVGTALLDALDDGHGALLLPIGLVCEVLFSPDGLTHLELAQARARLETYTAGHMLSSEVGHAWFAVAHTVLVALPDASARDWLERADKLLTDLKAAEYSGLSSILMAGFDQRLRQFATELQRFLHGEGALRTPLPTQSRGEMALTALEASADAVRAHKEASKQTDRLQRVDMALRLARYLATRPHARTPSSLSQAAVAYAEHGGYVDWARQCLLAGDPTAELAAAFGALAEPIRQVRERQNQQFASLLGAWNKAPTATADLVPIEQALSRIVARLATSTPVLLLVVDGMSYAVFAELCEDMRQRGWVELTNRPGQALPSLLSTVPSVTETSRASLLAGKLTRGQSPAEKQDFASHPDLLAACRAGYPPLLFHKGELVDASAAGVSVAVRQAIRETQRKAVGVVLNAVDDHLTRADQLRLSWAVKQFHHLDTILAEAQLVPRAVVLTSDHGHILEAGSVRLPGGENERWRAFSGVLTEAELVFEGPRVVAVTGERRLIAPWSETVRYSQKKHGYHGGATLQEMLVPIGVFTPPDHTLAGWEGLPDRKPMWWYRAEAPPTDAPTIPVRRTRRTKKSPTVQASLFATTEPQTDWIRRLLGSTVFTAQRHMAGRKVPDNRVVEACLRALEAHHGRMSCRALAQVLGQPDFRLRWLLAGLQRLLNVDGYQIVVVDEAAGTIEINRPLLDTQFQLLSTTSP